MIVVDTNVVSELMKPSPSVTVTDWVLARSGRELFTTSITLAEILYGIERLPGGRRKDLLRTTAHGVFDAFGDQVLPFGRRAAVHYSSVVGTRDRLGLPIGGFDAQIASICRTHDAGWRRATPRTSSTPVSTLSIRGKRNLRAVGQPERGFQEVGGESHGWASCSR